MIRDFLWLPRFRWFPIFLQNLPTKIDCFWCLENNGAGLNIHSDKPLSTSKTSVQALRLAKLKGLSRLSKIELWSTKRVHYIILTFTFKNRYKKLLLHSLIIFLLMDTQFFINSYDFERTRDEYAVGEFQWIDSLTSVFNNSSEFID